MKKKLIKLGFSSIMACLLLLSPLIASAQSIEDEKIDYLALGDSLAAGQTPDHKFDKGYADYLGSQLNKINMLASFNKGFAVSGYTTANVLSDIQANVEKPDGNGNMVPVQNSIKAAEIITIDAGANDLLHYVSINNSMEVVIDEQQIAEAMAAVEANIRSIIAEIKSINPDADIYVMGYYNPLPWWTNYQSQLQPYLDQLNEAISNAVSYATNTYAEGSLHITFVPTADSIAVNAKGYLPNIVDIHPNQAGYLVIANDFWKEINVGKSTDFTDKIPDVAKDEIYYLAEKGIIAGFTDGEFKPNNLISRVQSAIMLNRAIVYSDDAAPNPGYSDVDESSFGYDVIAKMTQEKVFSGSNNKFNPSGSLTRAQMAKILVQAFHLTGSSAKSFSDVSSNHWAAGYINILAANNITVGYGNGTFKPSDPITRAEFSIMLARAVNDSYKAN